MRIDCIRRQINADSARAGRGPNGWSDFLARLVAFTATMPPEGMPETEFARRALPIMDHERETLLSYLHRQGRIWRRTDGIARRVFAQRPEQPRPGRPRRSKPIDAVEQEAQRAFSDGMTALVDAIDLGDTSTQQMAAEALRKVAERLVRRGATWAAVREALRVYRLEAVAVLRRHETAFDPRSGECLIDKPSMAPRSHTGASPSDRILRAVEAAGPRGALRSRLARVTSSTAADLTTALAGLEAEGLLVARRSRGDGQGSRVVVRYTLGQGRKPEAA